MRLCASMGVALDIIEPCGFALDEKKLRRAAMDYIDQLDMTRHKNWDAFQESKQDARLVLLSTKASVPYTDFEFRETDILLAGRESAGVPDDVHNAVDARVLVPMAPSLRSLNVAISCAMVMGEALRQTNTFPKGDA